MIVKQICTDGSNSPDIYWGLSTDTKPTENIKNPSFFKEKDTSKEYVFNEDTQQWVELIGGINGDKLVEVTYGVTSYEELQTLLANGKIPCCGYETKQYICRQVYGAVTIRFYSIYSNTSDYIYINPDGVWGKGSNTLETTSNKKSTINPTSNTEFPSSKAVADYVEEKINGVFELDGTTLTITTY